jgi:NAD(P)-dependent dehydrogenase (short-subunit alcohol dehydrogenase family)
MKLGGKAALVAGGESGIGRATALLFRREGAKVVAADQIVDAGLEIRKENGEAMSLQMEVSNSAEVQGMVDATIKTCGRVEILEL